MAFNLAKDHVFGGGFMVWTAPLFQQYAPVPDDVHAAHSIYFQIMGEHGFIGLALFMAVGVSTWWTSRSLIRTARQHPRFRWAGDLGAMVQVSMIGYGITGAFLSLAYFDLPYNVKVMAALAQHFVRREMAAATAPAPSTRGAAALAVVPPPASQQR
jgi:probable O-glycosylation ligase (exosortase A-associated)